MSSSAARREKFIQVYAKIEEELVAHFAAQRVPSDGTPFPPEAIQWFRKSLAYNTPGGKLNRGISVVDTVEIIKGRPLDDDEYFRAAVLGWCVELLQAYFLVADDMMDSSITRRGQPCWYRLPSVGTIAINDSFMLNSSIYHLLKSHFKKESYYGSLLDFFHETTLQTEMGQLVDLITAPEDVVDLSKFSLQRHQLIVVFKTAFYSFYLPVALAMLFSGVPEDGGAYEEAKDILIPLGEYFQVQDDFLDFSGTPEQIGKIGTDIVDNKCSWVVNKALALASPEQRKILDENYGRKDAAKEAKVKEVFYALNIPTVYGEYEERIVSELRQKIANAKGVKGEVFESFLGKIYKRTK